MKDQPSLRDLLEPYLIEIMEKRPDVTGLWLCVDFENPSVEVKLASSVRVYEEDE